MAYDNTHKSIFFVKFKRSIWALAISKTARTLLFKKFKKNLKI